MAAKSVLVIVLAVLLWYVSSTQNPNMVTSQMEVNGLLYDAVCDWGKEVTNQIKVLSEVKWTPTKIKIRQDKEGKQASGSSDLDLSTISQYLGTPSNTNFSDPHSTNFHCVDGRYVEDSLFSMGGDAGALFLGILVYEELLNSELTPSQIKRLLDNYIDQMEHPRLHWCTDDQAVKHIEESLYETGIDIQEPRPDLQDDIIQIISDPMNIGDVHFKTLLSKYEQLNIRLQLVEDFIKVYYRTLWDTDKPYASKLELKQLVNSHKELAFVEIRQNKDCNAPLHPSVSASMGISLYINHHEASAARRAQIAYFITGQLKHNGLEFNPQIVERRLENHAIAFTEVTGQNFAKNLPFYTIVYE